MFVGTLQYRVSELSCCRSKFLLPTTANVRFTAIGPRRITSTASAFYRYQATYNSVPVANTVSFDGITFIKANPGIVIHDNLCLTLLQTQGSPSTRVILNYPMLALSASPYQAIVELR